MFELCACALWNMKLYPKLCNELVDCMVWFLIDFGKYFMRRLKCVILEWHLLPFNLKSGQLIFNNDYSAMKDSDELQTIFIYIADHN